MPSIACRIIVDIAWGLYKKVKTGSASIIKGHRHSNTNKHHCVTRKGCVLSSELSAVIRSHHIFCRCTAFFFLRTRCLSFSVDGLKRS